MLFQAWSPSLRERQGVCQTGCLAGFDQEIPDWLVKGYYIPGRGWNCSLVIYCWSGFAEVGLSTCGSIGGLLSLFFNTGFIISIFEAKVSLKEIFLYVHGNNVDFFRRGWHCHLNTYLVCKFGRVTFSFIPKRIIIVTSLVPIRFNWWIFSVHMKSPNLPCILMSVKFLLSSVQMSQKRHCPQSIGDWKLAD